MKYPDLPTQSKPVTGEEAKQALKAIDTGNSIPPDEEGQEALERILQRLKKRYGKAEEEVCSS